MLEQLLSHFHHWRRVRVGWVVLELGRYMCGQRLWGGWVRGTYSGGAHTHTHTEGVVGKYVFCCTHCTLCTQEAACVVFFSYIRILKT